MTEKCDMKNNLMLSCRSREDNVILCTSFASSSQTLTQCVLTEQNLQSSGLINMFLSERQETDLLLIVSINTHFNI